MDKNIEYYNTHAEDFYNGTVNVDMSLWRDKFEAYTEKNGKILDAGCGSGRDSRAFLQHGFSVAAFDASSEMCRRASELIGQNVWQMKFEDVDFTEEFEGVWACASLLHVPREQLPDTLKRLFKALKPGGILYASFKYGDGTVQRGERLFSDFNENTGCLLLQDAGFKICEWGITTDVRPDRGDEKWINIIGKKENKL